QANSCLHRAESDRPMPHIPYGVVISFHRCMSTPSGRPAPLLSSPRCSNRCANIGGSLEDIRCCGTTLTTPESSPSKPRPFGLNVRKEGVSDGVLSRELSSTLVRATTTL